jgi:hypothetical protein
MRRTSVQAQNQRPGRANGGSLESPRVGEATFVKTGQYDQRDDLIGSIYPPRLPAYSSAQSQGSILLHTAVGVQAGGTDTEDERR